MTSGDDQDERDEYCFHTEILRHKTQRLQSREFAPGTEMETTMLV